jgi:hypothetical protein
VSGSGSRCPEKYFGEIGDKTEEFGGGSSIVGENLEGGGVLAVATAPDLFFSFFRNDHEISLDRVTATNLGRFLC